MSSPKPRGLGFVVEATRFVGFVGGAERVANPATGGPARFALRLGSIDSGVVRGHRPVVRRPIAPHPPERKNQPEGNRAAMRTPSRSEIERENRGSATRSLTPGGSPSSFARFRVPDSGCRPIPGARLPDPGSRLRRSVSRVVLKFRGGRSNSLPEFTLNFVCGRGGEYLRWLDPELLTWLDSGGIMISSFPPVCPDGEHHGRRQQGHPDWQSRERP